MSVSRCERRVADASPGDVLDRLSLDELSLSLSSVPADASTLSLSPAPADVSALESALVDGSAPERGSAWQVVRRHWQIPVIVVMLAVAYVTLRGRLPDVHSIGQAISSADVRWIIVAAVCEAISLGMFARQQRSLLGAVEVSMTIPRALALTYARSALAISMPAGSAVSAGYAFQQYRKSGATNDKAAAVMVLSGIVSFLGLGLLYLAGIVGLIVSGPEAAFRAHPTLIYVVGGLAIVALAASMIRRRMSSLSTLRRPSASVGTDAGRAGRIRASVGRAVAAGRSLRARDWGVAGAFAVANWLFDLLCLAAAARAFALPVGLFTIASMYLGVQVIRQLPITPGGIGLIETGLLAGLTHAGAATGAAAGVVLAYRVLSCWLIIPLGGIAWLGLRARPATQQALDQA